jgi:hypothetical protein
LQQKTGKHPVFVYNLFMFLTADAMRLLLLFCAFSMALLAAFFLRGRSLSLAGYLTWGALIILLPLIGPFLVILLHPGTRRDQT